MHGESGQSCNTPVSYLSRGDVFGETEVLSDVPRKNAVRICESASIQRFRKKDFPELIRRVPAFFYYLSQQIASQVTKMTDLAFVQSNCLELSGNLSNFDLVTIYQTILNSAQTGVLSIVNEQKETSATFSFQEGQARQGTYYHLTGEEAFWQLLLHEKLNGTFSFSIAETDDNAGAGPLIRRNPTDLLITAVAVPRRVQGTLRGDPGPGVRRAARMPESGLVRPGIRGPAPGGGEHLAALLQLGDDAGRTVPGVAGVRAEVLQDRPATGAHRAFLAGS